MSSKSKPGLSDTPSNKASPATPKVTRKAAVSKLNKTPSKLSGDSPSPLQNPKAAAERSPRTIGRSSPRAAIPPEKAQSRILKPSDLLASAQDELKKIKEKLLLVEKEKAEALSELEEARKLAKDANEKLEECVVAQKQAEESSEVEKFWAAELEEDDGIEALQQKELEVVGVQDTMDLTFLLSTSEEHQRIKQELAMVTDTKNQALIHADEATKIAEIHAEKVETLSAELIRCKNLLQASENLDMTKLKSELDLLKQEAQKEESCEILKVELTSLKEEVERNNGLEIILAQKEESCEQLKLEFESVSRELEKAKVLENILSQKEKSFISEIESLKQELKKAKILEDKVSLGDESYEQLKTESCFLKREVEKAKEQLMWDLDSLKQELVKAKDLEEKLSMTEANYEKLKSEAESLKHELAKATGLKENVIQKDELLQELSLELEVLKKDLEKASSEQLSNEEKLFQREESYEQLGIELEASRIAESYSLNVLEELRDRVDELELQVEESSRLEKSLESVMKQLERNSDLLLAAECEINAHKEKVSLLEISLGKKKVDLEEILEKARVEASAATKEIVRLTSELKAAEEKKQMVINEMEGLRVEEEKSKRVMASALREVSAEARELKERLLSTESEHKGQVEDLNLMLKATNDKYESLLDDAKFEINHLKSAVSHSKLEFECQIKDMRLVWKETDEKNVTLLSEINQLKDTIEHLNSEWEKKELQLVNSVKTAENEKLALSSENDKYKAMLSDNIDHLRSGKTTDMVMLDDAKDEIKHLSNMIEKSKVVNESRKHEWEKQQVELMKTVNRLEEEKWSMEKEMMRLVNLLREKEKETFKARTCLREALGGEVENNTLKTDLQLHVSKVKELTRLLEEAGDETTGNADDDLSDSEKDYDMLPRVVEFSENDKEEHRSIADSESPRMMWESCKIDMEREADHESGDDDELDPKPEVGEAFNHLNAVQSESDSKEQQQQHKKKKPLYRKFGSLLKKGIGNQK